MIRLNRARIGRPYNHIAGQSRRQETDSVAGYIYFPLDNPFRLCYTVITWMA